MYCKYCGAELKNDAQFCTKCGKSFSDIDKKKSSDIIAKKDNKSNTLSIIIAIIFIPLTIFIIWGISTGAFKSTESKLIGTWVPIDENKDDEVIVFYDNGNCGGKGLDDYDKYTLIDDDTIIKLSGSDDWGERPLLLKITELTNERLTLVMLDKNGEPYDDEDATITLHKLE